MSVNSNGFAIKIVAGHTSHFKKDGQDHIIIPNLSNYKIKLTNNRAGRCDVDVLIDGVPVGSWRVNNYSSIVIERPANINRKFVFVSEKVFGPMDESINVPLREGVARLRYTNGLITAIFKPERAFSCPYEVTPFVVTPTFYDDGMYSWSDALQAPETTYFNSSGSVLQATKSFLDSSAYASGATILGAGTDQLFGSTQRLISVDESNITVINLRLVPSIHLPYTKIADLAQPNPFVPKLSDERLVYEVKDRFYNNDKVLIEKPYRV